jgi:RimJ/RimL family protein N-acetyltransferase
VADREVNRFLWDDVESREKAGRIAEEIISLDLRRFQFGHWAIQDKNTGAFLGWTALGKLCSWSGPSDEIAVSYALRRASWGQGFATEAAGHLVRYALQNQSLERVMAVVDARNTASKRVLEKIGMHLVVSDSVDGRCLQYFRIDAPTEPATKAGSIGKATDRTPWPPLFRTSGRL